MKKYEEINDDILETLDIITVKIIKAEYDWHEPYLGKEIKIYNALFWYSDDCDNGYMFYTTPNLLNNYSYDGYFFHPSCVNFREQKLNRILKY